jgi:hypothetical protein
MISKDVQNQQKASLETVKEVDKTEMSIIEKEKKIAKEKKKRQNKNKKHKFLEEEAGFIIDIEG